MKHRSDKCEYNNKAKGTRERFKEIEEKAWEILPDENSHSVQADP